MNQQSGFTLIEVLVVVAIIGIMSMVALPSYQDYLTRGRIPDATSSLAVKRVQLEQVFQDTTTYCGDAACATPSAPCALDSTTSKYFDFSCSAYTAKTYTLQAVGKDAMAGFTFTVNEANAKATTAVPAKWTANATCWVSRKGGQCI